MNWFFPHSISLFFSEISNIGQETNMKKKQDDEKKIPGK